MPETTPFIDQAQTKSKEEDDDKVCYFLGIGAQRIVLQIGHTRLSMNQCGCDNMIEQLTLLSKQLRENGK